VLTAAFRNTGSRRMLAEHSGNNRHKQHCLGWFCQLRRDIYFHLNPDGAYQSPAVCSSAAPSPIASQFVSTHRQSSMTLAVNCSQGSTKPFVVMPVTEVTADERLPTAGLSAHYRLPGCCHCAWNCNPHVCCALASARDRAAPCWRQPTSATLARAIHWRPRCVQVCRHTWRSITDGTRHISGPSRTPLTFRPCSEYSAFQPPCSSRSAGLRLFIATWFFYANQRDKCCHEQTVWQ